MFGALAGLIKGMLRGVPQEGTPKEITPDLLKLAHDIVGPLAWPFYVSISAPAGAKINKCHDIVADYIRKHGGRQVFGWSLWEGFIDGRLVWLVATFHSVWVSPDGGYTDLTPDEDGERERLFVADPRRVFNGYAPPKVYLPLTDEPHILTAIEHFRRAEAIGSKYKAGQQYSQPDAHAWMAEQQAATAALIPQMSAMMQPQPARRKLRLSEPVSPANSIGRNDPCPCGSGKKYKRCCRKYQD